LPRAFDRLADRTWVAHVAAKVGVAISAASAAPSPGVQGTAEAASAECCFEESLLTVGLSGSDSKAEASRDPFARYDQAIRLAPGLVGFLSLTVLGWKRSMLLGQTETLIRGIDPVRSRLDLIAGTLAVTLVLQAAIWLSETPADPEIEDVATWTGVENVLEIDNSAVAQDAAQELRWVWASLSACTRASSMVVFWKRPDADASVSRTSYVMRGGYFRRLDAGGEAPRARALCEEVMSTGKGRYLAQLKNYPSKEQFFTFLPERTQGLVLTPLRPAPNAPAMGVLALGVDAIRGMGKIDQAWVGALAEKLAVTLAAGDTDL